MARKAKPQSKTPSRQPAQKRARRKKATAKGRKGNKSGGFAKGFASVLKAALPLLALLPFSTSGSGVPLLGNGQMGGRNIPGGGGSLALTAPLANSFLSKSGVPQVRQRSSNSITITHREYVRKIRSRSDSDWKVDFIQQINPGNFNLFTYLSRFAGLYEGFKFKKLNFVYEPSTSTTTETAIYFAVDYDPADKNVESKDQLTSMPGSVKTTAWFQLIFNALGPNMNRQKLYNQVGAEQSPDEDIRLNSAGKFYIATENETASGKSIGDLFVEYEVELLIPQLSGDVSLDTVIISQSAPVKISSTETQIFGGVGTKYLKYGKLGCDILYGHTPSDALLSHQVRFPRPGYYQVFLKISGLITGNAFGFGPAFTAAKTSPSLLVNPPDPGNFSFPFDTFDGVGASCSMRTIQTFSPESRLNISFPNNWSVINSAVRVMLIVTQMDQTTFDEDPKTENVPTTVTLLDRPSRHGNFILVEDESVKKKVSLLKPGLDLEDSDDDDVPEEEKTIADLESELYEHARLADCENLDHLISTLSSMRLKKFGSRVRNDVYRPSSFIPLSSIPVPSPLGEVPIPKN